MERFPSGRWFETQSALPEGVRRREGAGITCVVTVHGVGINQERSGRRQGFADLLHEHLRPDLKTLLSANPDEDIDGPLYVVGKPDDFTGLDRLSNAKPLVRDGAKIAHVALVYTALDVTGFDTGSFFRGFSRILFHIFAYATPTGLFRAGVRDLLAVIGHTARDPDNPYPSLRVARYTMKRGVSGRLLPMWWINPQRDPASGLLVTFKQVVDDFLSYLCRGRVRDRIVDFVQQALVRIAGREDVGTIVLNTHSQGTVATFDALTDLDDDQPAMSVANVRAKVVWFITAGSPLRKVVELFGWRPLLRNFDAGWTNFWDRRDPAADPLRPPRSWRLGMHSDSNGGATLFRLSGQSQLNLRDRRVSNVANSSGGGLQAHNYWDNELQFVGPVGRALRDLA